MNSLKAYVKDREFVLDPKGPFVGTDAEGRVGQGDWQEVEKVALDIPEFIGHAFGTYTFTIQRADGSAVVHKYDDFYRIELTPIPVPAELMPEPEVVTVH